MRVFILSIKIYTTRNNIVQLHFPFYFPAIFALRVSATPAQLDSAARRGLVAVVDAAQLCEKTCSVARHCLGLGMHEPVKLAAVAVK